MVVPWANTCAPPSLCQSICPSICHEMKKMKRLNVKHLTSAHASVYICTCVNICVLNHNCMHISTQSVSHLIGLLAFFYAVKKSFL